MVVRIQASPPVTATALKSTIATALRVAAAVCFAVGVWIIAAGLSWAAAFVVQQGMFSHWQVWIAFGVALQLAAFRLNRQKRQLIS